MGHTFKMVVAEIDPPYRASGGYVVTCVEVHGSYTEHMAKR